MAVLKAGLPKPCVMRLKFVRPGYGLFGSDGLMVLGPPTASTIPWNSVSKILVIRGEEGKSPAFTTSLIYYSTMYFHTISTCVPIVMVISAMCKSVD